MKTVEAAAAGEMTTEGRLRGAYLTLAGALLVLALKLGAYWLTDSVALLSDAAESVVNIVAAFAVLLSMRLAVRPADYDHPYGHSKAEYVSSALEGGMILVAAGMILIASLPRLFQPEALTHLGVGVGVATLGAVLNGGLAVIVRREARRTSSAALEANARHLWTDVWTSLGVVVGVAAVALTGYSVLDPLIAVVVALNILRSGVGVMRRSLSRLMDLRLPEHEEEVILSVLNEHEAVLGYHRLRTRRAGFGRFAEMDIFVAGDMSVRESHSLVAKLENAIHAHLPNLVTTIHVEPYEPGLREGAVSPREEFAGP